MKKQFSSLSIAILTSISLAIPVAFAQTNNDRCDGWGMGERSWQTYDPATVETIRGEVIDIDTLTSTGGMSGGIHLRVKTQTGEDVTVRLGPAWYVDSQAVRIQLHDTIEVKGSRIAFKERSTLIAAEVKKGDRVLTLRDEKGVPVWSGRNRHCY
jgi:hypothetical protein